MKGELYETWLGGDINTMLCPIKVNSKYNINIVFFVGHSEAHIPCWNLNVHLFAIFALVNSISFLGLEWGYVEFRQCFMFCLVNNQSH